MLILNVLPLKCFLPLAFPKTTDLAQRSLFHSLENDFYSETLEKV